MLIGHAVVRPNRIDPRDKALRLDLTNDCVAGGFDRRRIKRPATACRGKDALQGVEIFDISVGGARLRPLTCVPQALPDNFTLLLSTCGKVRRTCNVVWRSPTELGVQFRKT
jgi:hypothetical protein